MGYQWHLRFEFVTGLSDKLYNLEQGSADGNFKQYTAKDSVSVDSFDCIIPIKVFGIRRGLRKWKSQKYELVEK